MIGAARAVLWIGAAAVVVLWIGTAAVVLWIGVAAAVILWIDAAAVVLKFFFVTCRPRSGAG